MNQQEVVFAGGRKENNLCVSAKRCRNQREVEVGGAEEGSEGLKETRGEMTRAGG